MVQPNKKRIFWITITILGFLGMFLLVAKVLGFDMSVYELYARFQHRNDPFYEFGCDSGHHCLGKPVIYLYPTVKQETSIKIDYKPGFFVTYPEYGTGWKVEANPNGQLKDLTDGKEYSYLFWEGNVDKGIKFDMSKGFVVSSTYAKEFLETHLAELGLNPKESNDFIVFWLPKLKQNKFNLIHFATAEEYDSHVKMIISPKPNSVLRVIMAYKTLERDSFVKPQDLPKFTRTGFTVVEWGGIEVK